MKLVVIIVTILMLWFSQLNGQAKDSLNYKVVSPENFQADYLKEDKALLIDVREYFEYKKKRIKDAVNIPSSGNLEFSADTISKDNALFLYCTSGFRSKRTADFFGKHGFSKVYSLDGGINAWEKEGKPVERKRH
jgi:rhodanese-related sulfurtransferase